VYRGKKEDKGASSNATEKKVRKTGVRSNKRIWLDVKSAYLGQRKKAKGTEKANHGKEKTTDPQTGPCSKISTGGGSKLLQNKGRTKRKKSFILKKRKKKLSQQKLDTGGGDQNTVRRGW